MDKLELGLAAGIAASVAGGVQAETPKDVSQDTKQEVAQIQAEVEQNPNVNFDMRGASDHFQANASYINGNKGLGIQLSHSEKVDQLAMTGGMELTPNESSALAKVVENGVVKVSLVQSQVENALADFDETGIGLEFVANLKNALVKQVSIAHSVHSLDITDGSDAWQITGVETSSNTNTLNTGSQTIQTTTTITTTHETRNNAEKVNQTAIQVLLGITKDLDLALGYTRDNLGKTLASAKAKYQINENWSLNAGYQETSKYSGAETQEITSATVNYQKGNRSAFAGMRDNGIDTSPYGGIQYRVEFGKPKNPAPQKKRSGIGSSLTSPVQGSAEVHPHAIKQETRSTTTQETSESVDNHAKGSLSNVQTTTDSCSADFNVSDKDGVSDVLIRLSNGAEKRIASKSGSVTFAGLSPDTSYGLVLYGITGNGISNGSDTQKLGSATCKTKKEETEPETPEEHPTQVSSISGDSSIKVGDTPTYSITATDGDHGIDSVKAMVNGAEVSVSNGGNTYFFTLPRSASAAEGSAEISFIVKGTKADGSAEPSIKKKMNISIEKDEPPISTPNINPIGVVNIQDNGGLPTTVISSISGSEILTGAVFSLESSAPGLSINSASGEITHQQDVGGNQSYSVTVRVTNPDGGSDTETFTLNVEDNG